MEEGDAKECKGLSLQHSTEMNDLCKQQAFHTHLYSALAPSKLSIESEYCVIV